MKTIEKCFKILSGMLITIILLNLLIVPIESFAEETNNTYTVDGVTAILADDGTLTISGTGKIKRELIKKFDYQNAIKSVVINEGVTSIEEYAFYYCENLISITIPNSVTSIEDFVFYRCSSLTSITIPNGVTSIGISIFSDCSSLSSINVSSENNSFSSEDGVLFDKNKETLICCPAGKTETNYNIPEGVISIRNNAFRDCCRLTSITIPNSVTSIENGVFEGNELVSININENNEFYTSKDGILFDKNKETLICYPAGKTEISYNIPNGVTSIEYSAFSGCENLTTINIPNGVTSIKGRAFYDCGKLTSITIPNSVTSIGDYAFYWCDLKNINIPEGLKCIENGVFGGNDFTNVTIPNSVTGIGNGAFEKCDSLTSITIPNSVISIGSGVFYECSSLTSIDIPESVTSIGDSAFCGCSSLTSITIPNSVTSIGDSAFYECRSLTSITISNSVTSIGNDAFANCESLENINIPEGLTCIGKYAFLGCESLTSITIPTSVTSIGERAFYWCSNLTSITIPNSVTSIENDVFKYCNENLKIYCKSNSKAKEYAEENDLNYIIDDDAPIISGNVDGWTKNNVTLTIEDEKCGLKEVKVNREKIDIGEDGKVVYTISENGEWTVVAKDYLENIKEESIVVNNIDKTAPTLEVTKSSTSWTKEMALTIRVADNESGINNVKVNGTPIEVKKGQATYKVTENGTYEIVATDNVGNTKEETVTVSKIDKTKPTITSVTKTPETQTEGKVTLKVEAQDNESGIKEYSFDDGKTWQTSKEKEYYQNTEGIKIKVKDNVENIKAYEETINITNIENREDLKKGDINEDTKINIADVIAAIRHISAKEGSKYYLNEKQRYIADINDDGQINIADVIGIIRLITTSK